MPIMNDLPRGDREDEMRFEAKTKEQIQDEKILPAGEYPFEVIKAEEGKSKKGADMISLTLKVFPDNGPARLVNDWIGSWQGGEEKILGFCEATGITDLYMSGMFGADDCRGLTGYAKLRVQESEQFGTQNQVQLYIPKVHSGLSARPNKASQYPQKHLHQAVPDAVEADVPF